MKLLDVISMERLEELFENREELLDEALQRAAKRRGYLLIPDADRKELIKWFESYRAHEPDGSKVTAGYELARKLGVWP